MINIYLSFFVFLCSIITSVLAINIITTNNNIPYNQIWMRPDNNTESDAIVKKRMLDAIQRTCNVVAVFDDRDKVVNMWRENGILCCQVAKGEY